jgi:leader peptidase (prepilin peptidase)/N-methyltransferase
MPHSHLLHVGLIVAAGVLGLMVGSFLNVVIWRVPRAESVVRPRSHCPSCGTLIAERDNIPLVSWLLLQGRCRSCRARISVRYPAVEMLTALMFAATAALIGWRVALIGFLYFTATAIALAAIDLDTKRLPNALTFPAYAVGVTVLALDGLVSGDWHAFVRAAIGMAALYGFYFLLALVYPAGMGFGDVKLAGVLGLFLGWLGYSQLVIGSFLAFLLGGVFGMAAMAVKKAGRKSQLPYGPFMVLGAVIGMFAGHPLAQLYLNGMS